MTVQFSTLIEKFSTDVETAFENVKKEIKELNLTMNDVLSDRVRTGLNYGLKLGLRNFKETNPYGILHTVPMTINCLMKVSSMT